MTCSKQPQQQKWQFWAPAMASILIKDGLRSPTPTYSFKAGSQHGLDQPNTKWLALPNGVFYALRTSIVNSTSWKIEPKHGPASGPRLNWENTTNLFWGPSFVWQRLHLRSYPPRLFFILKSPWYGKLTCLYADTYCEHVVAWQWQILWTYNKHTVYI